MKSKWEGEKLATLDFLGFTHFMTRGRNGGLKLGRKTIGKRMSITVGTIDIYHILLHGVSLFQ